MDYNEANDDSSPQAGLSSPAKNLFDQNDPGSLNSSQHDNHEGLNDSALDPLLIESSEKPTTLTPIDDLPLILIVDDECLNIEVLQEMLESTGHRSDSALNGQLALEMIKTRL